MSDDAELLTSWPKNAPKFIEKNGMVYVIVAVPINFTKDDLDRSKLSDLANGNVEASDFLLCQKKIKQAQESLRMTTRDLFRHLNEARGMLKI